MQIFINCNEKQENKKEKEELEVDLSKLNMYGIFDATGIHMTATYHGHQIHYMLLATYEFRQWLTMTPNRRMALLNMKINRSAFNDNQYIVDIIDLLLKRIYDTINNLMLVAQRYRALRFTMH